jgi:Ran-binding protein 1
MSENLQAFLASKKEDDEDAEEEVNPEEEVKGDWKAVDLPEVEVRTGEEEKDLIYKGRGKLYRWTDEQWKERGTGDIKLLRDRTSHKVTLVMRQDNTKKVVVNFLLEEDPLCQLVPHAGSDKAWLWMAHDYSEGEAQRHKFALRLSTPEKSQEFKKAFEDAKKYNHCIRNGLDATPAPVVEDTKTDDAN